ncbi:hypothetical protein [Pseudomonas sp.]|uniref:hypothetical protein n=1 Tax=Pseudomonas sp. TaxID=306 RepID=UPI003FD883A0
MFITQKAPSRRTPVLSDQVQLFALLTRDLIRANEQSEGMGLEKFFELPEYQKFVLAAYACGFVCRDYSPMDGGLFEQMKNRPQEHLGACQLRVLRHWLHMLLRAERWAGNWSSHIQEALDSGALEVVVDRLERDQTLLEPEVIEEDAGR